MSKRERTPLLASAADCEWTSSTIKVRKYFRWGVEAFHGYALRGYCMKDTEAAEAFDHWLEERDRQIAERAFDKAWDYIGSRILQYVPEGAIPLMPSSETIRTSHQFEDPNPYRRSES